MLIKINYIINNFYLKLFTEPFQPELQFWETHQVENHFDNQVYLNFDQSF